MFYYGFSVIVKKYMLLKYYQHFPCRRKKTCGQLGRAVARSGHGSRPGWARLRLGSFQAIVPAGAATFPWTASAVWRFLRLREITFL